MLSRKISFAAALAVVFAAISIVFADPGSQVALTNIDTPDPVASGTEITYTLTARNTGGSKIDNAVLTDQFGR